MQGGDQYSYTGSYPGYGYEASHVSSPHNPAGYYANSYSKQSNFSDHYQGSGYPSDTKPNYYYSNCQGGPGADPHTANTPLPPDFSYVGSSNVQNSHQNQETAATGSATTTAAGYTDFYAMG